VLWVVVLCVVELPVDVSVEVEVDVSVDGAMPVSDEVVLSTVVDSVVVVLWPQAASPTRQATADAARIDFNIAYLLRERPAEAAHRGLRRYCRFRHNVAATSRFPVEFLKSDQGSLMLWSRRDGEL
jgi:hypothetical protein